MKTLILVVVVLVTVGCTEKASGPSPMPAVPSVNLGPGLGGSSVSSSGISYLLECQDGTISINSSWKRFSDIDVENMGHAGGRQLANTGVDRLTCSLEEGSFEINENPGRITGFASAGDWICEGVDLQFTIGGYLASTPVDAGNRYQLTKTAPLEWQLSDASPCLFIVD